MFAILLTICLGQVPPEPEMFNLGDLPTLCEQLGAEDYATRYYATEALWQAALELEYPFIDWLRHIKDTTDDPEVHWRLQSVIDRFYTIPAQLQNQSIWALPRFLRYDQYGDLAKLYYLSLPEWNRRYQAGKKYYTYYTINSYIDYADAEEGINANKRFIEAWMHQRKPRWKLIQGLKRGQKLWADETIMLAKNNELYLQRMEKAPQAIEHRIKFFYANRQHQFRHHIPLGR